VVHYTKSKYDLFFKDIMIRRTQVCWQNKFSKEM